VSEVQVYCQIVDIEIGPNRVLNIKLKIVESRQRRVFGRLVTSRLRMIVDHLGEVQVLIPKRVSETVITDFVLENLEWIEKQQARQSTRRETLLKNHPPKKFLPGELFRFYGVERQLVFEPSDKMKLQFEIVENYLVAHMPYELMNADEAEYEARYLSLKAGLAKFAEAEARRHLTERIQFWSDRMKLKASGLSFRNQKTRWGSCSTAGHVSLNWKLVFAPEAVIDYVVIHELAHLVHANHSAKFWSLVETFDPDARIHRRWLRDHQLETIIYDKP
jgi:predicted metal-dependent hydrolase